MSQTQLQMPRAIHFEQFLLLLLYVHVFAWCVCVHRVYAVIAKARKENTVGSPGTYGKCWEPSLGPLNLWTISPIPEGRISKPHTYGLEGVPLHHRGHPCFYLLFLLVPLCTLSHVKPPGPCSHRQAPCHWIKATAPAPVLSVLI